MLALQVKNLNKVYQKKLVVNDVSLTIKEREIVGLLGPNGAGKTTIFHIILGLVKPTGGKVFLDEEEITHLPTYQRTKKGIAYLPQKASIFQKLSVKDNLMAILETLNLSWGEREERANHLLLELGIAHLSGNKASLLSGGERRRVEIARALVTSPHFILFDEPFSGIDPITVFDLQEIICNLKNKGIGILITDHNVRETLRITDFSYLISQGKVLISGKKDELIRSREARKIYLGDKFKL